MLRVAAMISVMLALGALGIYGLLTIYPPTGADAESETGIEAGTVSGSNPGTNTETDVISILEDSRGTDEDSEEQENVEILIIQ